MKLRRAGIFYLAGLLLAVVAGGIAIVALRQSAPAAAPARPTTRPVIVPPWAARLRVATRRTNVRQTANADVRMGISRCGKRCDAAIVA